MYKYKNIDLAKPGDIVQFTDTTTSQYTKGKLYIVRETVDLWDNLGTTFDDNDSTENGMADYNFKLLETLPSSQENTKVGDEFIVIDSTNRCYGKVFAATGVMSSRVYWTDSDGNHCNNHHSMFRTLQKEETIPDEWLDLISQASSIVDNVYHRFSPSEQGAGTQLHDCGYNALTALIYDFRQANPTLTTISLDLAYAVPCENQEDLLEFTEEVISQLAKKPLAITDHVINISDSTLLDRLHLRQVLLDNEQTICSLCPVHMLDTEINTSLRVSIVDSTWTGAWNKPTIELADFISQYKKQDDLRNIAYYKRSETDWTEEELQSIPGYWKGGSIVGKLMRKYVFDNRNTTLEMFVWEKQTKHSNFDNCLQVAYEDMSFAVTAEQTTKETPMTKPLPLFSGLLKAEGIYEKFLANLSITHPGYINYTCENGTDWLIDLAFKWSTSNEGHYFWEDCNINHQECINDVRAPDDIDYWQKQWEENEPVWGVDPTDNDIMKLISISPETTASYINWYPVDPTWLLPKEAPAEATEITVGSKWVRKEDNYIYSSPKGEIVVVENVTPTEIYFNVHRTLRRESFLEKFSPIETTATYDGPILHTQENVSAPCATTETSETTATKETIMSSDRIEIKVNGQEINTGSKVTKQKTDLQLIKKVSIIAVYLGENGAEVGVERITGKSAEKDAFALLNKNKYRGCSVATFGAKSVKRAAIQLENA